MPRKKLKLFVWENVLSDYTEGMIIALAYDLKHALELVEKKDRLAVGNARAVEPKIITDPEAFTVWGGG